jgi:Restriction endonuclease
MPAQASRTLNPLHFEDLEPHRFEDLIRQLAYGFREWSRIEATGRLGQDEGVDIRALETVTATTEASESDEDEGEEPRRIVLEEREWRIQCKRYKQMGPKFVRGVVTEAVPDPSRAPYGLIVAAACDVSAQAITAFHEERLSRGVREGHLWTKAHLEDLLFLPENDHLLFAYFGISLGTRRKSQLQQLQAMITLKRKLLRAYKKESLHSVHREDVVIHDVSDSTYPKNEIIEGVPKEERVDIILARFLPFSSILEVDPIGDIAYEGVHLYCRYGGSDGPFEKDAFMFIYRRNGHDRYKRIEPDEHKPLFATLQKKRKKGKPPRNFISNLKEWYYSKL